MSDITERAMDTIDKLVAEIKRLRAQMTIIADFDKCNLTGEYEHGLRDIIRSMTDCARRALEGK
jgi:hypothetical protein